MFQAAIAHITPAPLAHLFASRRAAPVAGSGFRERVELLRKRAELLRDQAAATDPLTMLYYVEGLIVAPLAALRREPAARASAYAADRLADAAWELDGYCGSIGDTVHPDTDRADCVSIAEQALDEAASFLAAVVRSLRP